MTRKRPYGYSPRPYGYGRLFRDGPDSSTADTWEAVLTSHLLVHGEDHPVTVAYMERMRKELLGRNVAARTINRARKAAAERKAKKATK